VNPPTLVQRITTLCTAFDTARISHALGGALALAYATAEPRATRDIDIDVFLPAADVGRVFAALPEGVRRGRADAAAVRTDDQVRLWWDDTPVDLFFAAERWQFDIDRRCRTVPFADGTVRVLAAEDLAVYKALFDRRRDWVDIESMAECGALDSLLAAERLAALLGDNEARVLRLRHLA
jgi:hypothetical protein